jgi:hypothetical protein
MFDLSKILNISIGFIFGIVGYLIGRVLEYTFTRITEFYSSGHITVDTKKANRFIRATFWFWSKIQRSLDDNFSNKHHFINGVYFMYRLIETDKDQFEWEYSEIVLSANLALEIKGTNDKLLFEAGSVSNVFGNFVQGKILILFLSDNNILNDTTTDIMITIPEFKEIDNKECNVGWSIYSLAVDTKPHPVVFRKDMLNFPKQLKHDKKVLNVCASYGQMIQWESFSNKLK